MFKLVAEFILLSVSLLKKLFAKALWEKSLCWDLYLVTVGFCSSWDLVSMVIFTIFDHSFAMLVLL